jgi:hypothetical protein
MQNSRGDLRTMQASGRTILGRIRSALRRRHGQSMVETAFVLPVLALLTFGLLDFGRAYYFQVSVTNSAREGTRSGILNIYTGPATPSCSSSNGYATCPVQTDLAVQQAVVAELNNTGITPSAITICPPHDGTNQSTWTPTSGWTSSTCGPIGGLSGCSGVTDRVDLWLNGCTNYYITANVQYQFQLYTPLLQNLVGNPVNMSVTVQMRTNY